VKLQRKRKRSGFADTTDATSSQVTRANHGHAQRALRNPATLYKRHD
jgi:hypothetical protein